MFILISVWLHRSAVVDVSVLRQSLYGVNFYLFGIKRKVVAILIIEAIWMDVSDHFTSIFAFKDEVSATPKIAFFCVIPRFSDG